MFTGHPFVSLFEPFHLEYNIVRYIRRREKRIDGYTARQVITVTGVSYQTLNHWARTGLVEPSIAQAAGTGSERVYSFRDLIALKLAVELRKGGVTTRALRKVIDFLRSSNGLESPISEARLVVTASDIVLVR